VSKKRIGISDVDIIQGRIKETLPIQPNEQLINQINMQVSSQPNHSLYSNIKQYQAPQTLESVKKQIPSEDIWKYTDAFLLNYLTEILYQDPYLHNMLQHRLIAINSICWEIVNSCRLTLNHVDIQNATRKSSNRVLNNIPRVATISQLSASFAIV
jgi:hypothetical protein